MNQSTGFRIKPVAENAGGGPGPQKIQNLRLYCVDSSPQPRSESPLRRRVHKGIGAMSYPLDRYTPAKGAEDRSQVPPDPCKPDPVLALVAWIVCLLIGVAFWTAVFYLAF